MLINWASPSANLPRKIQLSGLRLTLTADKQLLVVWVNFTSKYLLTVLKESSKLNVTRARPQVAYKEAITASYSHREVFKKQTGGSGKFADIQFDIMPADDDFVGLQFVNEVKGGNIPKEYIPSVEKGFREAMANGPSGRLPA